jgi:NDP-sugar pyrophosphorylase family protein
MSSQASKSILRDTTAVILAGGFGTRLASIVPDLPKPMAPVNGRPFLEYLLEYVRNNGISDVILCLHHLASVVEKHFGDGRCFGLRIRYSREITPCGTGGAIRLASALVKTNMVVVFNGDSFCPVDLEKLVSVNQDSSADLTMVATCVEDTSRYGSLEYDPDTLLITGFREKSVIPVAGGWINAGIYTARRSFFANLPDSLPCSLEKEIFPDLCQRHALGVFLCGAPFLDIGTPDSYFSAGGYFAKAQGKENASI